MKFTLDEAEAVLRLLHGDYKADFNKFLGALGRYAGVLNESLIYCNSKEVSVETKQGETRAVAEIIKAIEKATKQTVPSGD